MSARPQPQQQPSREQLLQATRQMLQAGGRLPEDVRVALDRLPVRALERFGFLRCAVLAAFVGSPAASRPSSVAPTPLVEYLAGRCDPTAPVRRPPLVRLLAGHRGSASIHEDSDQSPLVVSASLGLCFITGYLTAASALPRLEAVFRIQQQRTAERDEEEGGSLVFRSQPLTVPSYLMLLLYDGHLAWSDCRLLLNCLADRGYRFHGDRVPDAAPLRCLHRLNPRRLDDSRPGLAESRMWLVRRLLSWLLSNGWDCRSALAAGLQDCGLSANLPELHAAVSAAGVTVGAACSACRRRLPASLADLCSGVVRRRLTLVANSNRGDAPTLGYRAAVLSLPLPPLLVRRCLDGGLGDILGDDGPID